MNDDSASTTRSSSPARFAVHALKYGTGAGLLGGLWMIADYALGFQTDHMDIGRWTHLGGMIIPIAAVILGMMSWRNKALGGRIRFVQAFGMALAVGLVFALFIGAAAWLQTAQLAPELIPHRIDQQAIAAAQQPNSNPDEIAKQAELAKQQTTPVAFAKMMFSYSLMQSLFIGLIASITVPKQRPGLP